MLPSWRPSASVTTEFVARGVEVRLADCDRAVGEYDIVLLNATPASSLGGCPVEVVAIAEVKRNVADLVNAQHQRVNLASEIERSRRQFSQQQRSKNGELLEICLPTPNNKDSPAFEELFRGSRSNRRGGRSIPFAGMMTFGDHVVECWFYVLSEPRKMPLLQFVPSKVKFAVLRFHEKYLELLGVKGVKQESASLRGDLSTPAAMQQDGGQTQSSSPDEKTVCSRVSADFAGFF